MLGTNTDEHARPIYSTALFSTASRAVGSTARTFRSRCFLVATPRRSCCCYRGFSRLRVALTVDCCRREEVTCYDVTEVILLLAEPPWANRVAMVSYALLTPLSRPWRDTSRVRNTSRVPSRNRSTFTFTRLLPVRDYRRGRFLPPENRRCVVDNDLATWRRGPWEARPSRRKILPEF